MDTWKKAGIKIVTDLLKIRTIVTLSVLFTFLSCVLDYMIKPEVLVGVLSTLIGFWFGEKTGKIKAKNEKSE